MTHQEHQEQRLAVAKDALKQLQEDKLTVKTGCFLKGQLSNQLYNSIRGSAQEILKVGLKAGMECQVCAKGTLFISHILLFNEVSCSQAFWADERNTYLFLEEFPKVLLDEFEYLFELSESFLPAIGGRNKSILQDYTRTRGLRAMHPKERLIFLLELFIKNDGEYLVIK